MYEQDIELTRLLLEKLQALDAHSEQLRAEIQQLQAEVAETRQVRVVYVREPSSAITRQFRDRLRGRLLAELPAEVARRAVEGSALVVRSPGAEPGSAR